ncbi:TonB-dependent receptor domain-containing protein, partial [Rubrivirga sp.]|uniref:TonB-dependent receptor domain-containing protein n=1 Tax=Rubrivirga sp. TaxID=1885344 RepID=UPI003C78F051
ALGGERYGDNAPRAENAFAFVQHDWETRRVALNASARLDAYGDVGTRVSPKVAALVRGDLARVRLSVGSGFKAPDFRQLYLEFSNAVGGYTLFGADRLEDGLARLEAQGRYTPVATSGDALDALRPETSVAVNLEVETTIAGVEVTAGVFRNAVRDLIDVQPVALLADGAPVLSYVNLERIRTEGLTLEARRGVGAWSLQAGYQWLRSRDLDVLAELGDGTVFGRDPVTGRDRRLAPGDYANLFGRSSHSVTARAGVRTGDWTGSLRGRWRSRYGLRDLDGNGFANRDDEFVPGTALFDLAVARDLEVGATGLRLQLGIDNLLDTTRPALVPTLAGRRFFAAATLSL